MQTYKKGFSRWVVLAILGVVLVVAVGGAYVLHEKYGYPISISICPAIPVIDCVPGSHLVSDGKNWLGCTLPDRCEKNSATSTSTKEVKAVEYGKGGGSIMAIDKKIIFTASPQSGAAPLTVGFSVSGIDPLKDYMIFFGDQGFNASDIYHAGCLQGPAKETTEGAQPVLYDCGVLRAENPLKHIYSSPGVYKVSFIEEPGLGQRVVATTTITVTQ